MSSNRKVPVKVFIDRIKSAKRLIDEANQTLIQQYEAKEYKHLALKTYFTNLGILLELLKDARTELDTIIKKLDKGNAPIRSKTVTGFRERISKVLLDCSTLINSGIESDLLESHLNLISEVKAGIHYIERYGIDYILKNVQRKICKS